MIDTCSGKSLHDRQHYNYMYVHVQQDCETAENMLRTSISNNNELTDTVYVEAV